MEHLRIEGRKGIYFSPEINFNATTGICEISGESYLEDAFEFYERVQNWIEAYQGERLIVKISLTYFNTSSSKGILGVLKALKQKQLDGINVFITWYYPSDNYDLKMEGEDFMQDVDMQFMFIPYHLEEDEE